MLRAFLVVGLIAVSALAWADRRGWGMFDERGHAGGGVRAGSGRVYHK